jgi:hypothetical protein
MGEQANGLALDGIAPSGSETQRVPKKLPRNKQLQNECEELWKEIVKLRDGACCKVKDLYPEIMITHTLPYQADHCFTRSNKHLFLDPANGTMVCSSCNMAKHYDNKSVKRAVDAIVKKRVGKKKWADMLACDMQMGPNVNWSSVWWLEEQRDKLLNDLFVIKRKKKKLIPKHDLWLDNI